LNFSKTNDSWAEELPKMSDYCASMAFLELYPIVVAAVLWGKTLVREKGIFFTVTILRQCKLLKMIAPRNLL